MADTYLLDTSIASALWDEWHENHTEFRERLGKLGDAVVYVSVVSLAEVEYGLRIAPRIDEERQRRVRVKMSELRVLALDRHVVEYYADLRAQLFRKHSPRKSRGRLTAKVVPDLWERTPDKLLGIQENDLWLASAAIERNLVLVTTDRLTHIQAAAGDDLRVERWGQRVWRDQALDCLGEDTRDVYLNGVAYWSNVPARVWDYYIGGYQVIKKQLSYREAKLLGRGLRPEEAKYVTEMVRRLAALRLLEPALDANYEAAKADTYPFPTT